MWVCTCQDVHVDTRGQFCLPPCWKLGLLVVFLLCSPTCLMHLNFKSASVSVSHQPMGPLRLGKLVLWVRFHFVSCGDYNSVLHASMASVRPLSHLFCWFHWISASLNCSLQFFLWEMSNPEKFRIWPLSISLWTCFQPTECHSLPCLWSWNGAPNIPVSSPCLRGSGLTWHRRISSLLALRQWNKSLSLAGAHSSVQMDLTTESISRELLKQSCPGNVTIL